MSELLDQYGLGYRNINGKENPIPTTFEYYTLLSEVLEGTRLVPGGLLPDVRKEVERVQNNLERCIQ